MIIKSFYVVQDRGNKLFKSSFVGWAEDVTEADHYFDRALAYHVAGDNYDVMVYKVSLEKDRF